MKNKQYAFSVVILLGVFCLLSCSPAIPRLDNSNKEVINYQDFLLNTDNINLNTNIKGTIFVKSRDNSNTQIFLEIVSWVEIDTRDWAGVGFEIPKELYVSSISTSYPQGNPDPENYVVVWYNDYYDKNPDLGYPIWIRIGESKNTDRVRGGYGCVVIELDLVNNKIPDFINILVGAGSEGENIAYPCSQILEIPISVDYRE